VLAKVLTVGLGLAASIASATTVAATASAAHVFPAGRVSQFATASGKTYRTIKVGRNPTDIAIAPDGKFVYAANYQSQSITAIGTARSGMVKSMRVNGFPMAMALTPNSKLLYVSLVYGTGKAYDGRVLVVRTSGFKPVKSIAVGVPGQIAMAPDGKTAYVLSQSLLDTEVVTPIRTATNTAEKPIAIASDRYGGQSIAITPNGRYAYVVSVIGFGKSSQFGVVSAIRLADRRVLRRIAIGRYPSSIVITPNSRTVYVSSWAVIPIRTASNRAGRPIKVGIAPGAMVVTPNGKTVYVTNAQGDVVPISTARDKAGHAIFFGYNSYAPQDSAGALAASPDGATVYELTTSPYMGMPGAAIPIPTATNKLGTPIIVGPNPIKIVMAPDGKTGYVLDQVGNPY
jgi:DNA-binding beta-propeller fold protein YncE